MNDHYNLMYPIGKFDVPDFILEHHIDKWIQTIEETPILVRNLVEGLSSKELNYAYRPKGWNICQVVHHINDSHTNAYIRFKLSLTEDTPIIKPYHEGLWAKMADYHEDFLHYSLQMLEAVHAKWVIILKSITIADFHKNSYFHPETHKNFTLGEVLGLYDWHSRHHLEHIKQALNYKGEFD